MNLSFSKYQGTGNDFIMIDDRNGSFQFSRQLVRQLCDRNFGIGADGLILIQNHPTHDYRMVYYNADGSQSLCGNGSRCGFAFAKTLEMVDNKATFETTDGTHEIIQKDDLIHFQLFDTSVPAQLNEKEWFINTGSPHHIIISEDVQHLDIITLGRKIRYSENYSGQNGTNVNFAQLLPEKVKIRTYERGVENETLSCGTGVTAVALLAGTLGMNGPIAIETEGGNLSVSFERDRDKFTNIWLAGPAEKVFEGTVTI